MKQYIITIILALCMASCSQHSKHWETLAQVESFIEERPDSALTVLQGMDKGEFSGMEEKAKHALLLSMAMDKNYIDRTDLDILQPAIDYYKDNGSVTDKLRTYYYLGRIYQNMGNDALAMESYVNAINNGETSDDILTKARLYVAQGNIYYALMKWEKVCEVNLKAADYFLRTDKINSYINCILKAVSAFTQNRNYQESVKYLTECEKHLDVIPKALIANYYSEYLTYLIHIEEIDKIKEVVSVYESEIPNDLLDYGTLSNVFIALGEYRKALEVIYKVDNFPNMVSEMRYYAILSEIHHKLGNHKDALDAYMTFNKFNDSVNIVLFNQDTQFIEERHALEMQKAKETEVNNRLTIIVLACVIALMASLYILNFIRKRLKETKRKNIQLEGEKAHYERMYLEVLSERNALNDMISNSTVKDETMEIIKKRLGVLNTIIVSHLSEKGTDVKRANDELERLIADRNGFIKSTRLTLEENYPHFFAFLHDKGLEEFEIDFCCLYAIGMKGKEVKAYTSNRHYKDSSEVRQKLGLAESDTNLSIYLQKLLKNQQG